VKTFGQIVVGRDHDESDSQFQRMLLSVRTSIQRPLRLRPGSEPKPTDKFATLSKFKFPTVQPGDGALNTGPIIKHLLTPQCSKWLVF